jgi:flagellar biosynthesis protein FlhF
MQVKKYRAKTIKEAIGRVKRVLGPDAMIISTQKLKGDGENQNHVFEVAAVPPGKGLSKNNANPFREVKSELMSIKEMIYLLNHSSSIVEKLMMNPATLSLYARLIRNGVNDHYARIFLERAGALQEHLLNQTDHIMEKTIKEMMQTIKVQDPFKVSNGNQVIAAFIGTTGVGKTTTIAKLAAQLMLKARKKVGLISIDKYRIGAMEQLKTYATILGIPCFPAFNKKDLLFALKSMDGRDVVLVDTAGQSQYDGSRIEELKKMIAGDLDISSHLLLSVSTTESEMNKTAINFGPIKFQSYIFTKIDEAERCGSIINQIMKLDLPISYITTGQNVPEDIEKAKKAQILKLLLNKK